MFASSPYRFFIILLLALPLALAACDSSDPDDSGDPDPDPPIVTAPEFSVASQTVQLQDGSDGIVFFVIPDEDVVLVRVEITNPRNQMQTFNAQSTTVVEGEEFALQEAGIAYIRVSGTWEFTFVGRRAAGDQASFEVTETIEVGA